MAKSFPFESKRIIGNEWDRAITAQDERDFNKLCWGNGVFINPIDGLMVTAHGGMTVNVKPGGAIIEGAVFKESNNRQITLSSASSLPRIDRIVLRFDTAEDRRDIDIYLKEGVAATNPVAQDLIRESNYYELAIADIYIPARTTSIESVNISDTRMDSNLCGWVVPAVEYRGLFDNLWQQLRDSFGTVNSALSGTLAQDLKQEIKSTDEKYADQIKSVRDDMGNVNMLKTSARNLADAINEIFNKIKKTKDFIVSREDITKDGISWTVVKYDSGDMHAWGNGQVTFPAGNSTAISSWWWRKVIFVNLPIAFYKLTSVIAQGSYNGGMLTTNDFSEILNASKFELHHYSSANMTSQNSWYAHFEVRGRWK